MNSLPVLLKYHTDKRNTPNQYDATIPQQEHYLRYHPLSLSPYPSPSTSSHPPSPFTNKCRYFHDNYYTCLLEQGANVLSCERAYQFYDSCQYYCKTRDGNCEKYIKGLSDILNRKTIDKN